ncbi:MAG: PIN domain-containing protein [Myxococcales bacterium]
MAVSVFLDTSVLVAGSIEFGPQSDPARSLLDAVAEKRIGRVSTGWHCCLEFYSVTTRLPPEFRLTPADAARLVAEEILARMAVQDLPAPARRAFIRSLAQDGVIGGRIYDAQIADVARAAAATVIVTDNRRHFVSALRHGLRVETPAEFLSTSKKK